MVLIILCITPLKLLMLGKHEKIKRSALKNNIWQNSKPQLHKDAVSLSSYVYIEELKTTDSTWVNSKKKLHLVTFNNNQLKRDSPH